MDCFTNVEIAVDGQKHSADPKRNRGWGTTVSGGAQQRNQRHLTLNSQVGPRKDVPPPQVWTGPPSTHPYMAILTKQATKGQITDVQTGGEARGEASLPSRNSAG